MQANHIFPRVPFYEGRELFIMLIVNDSICRGGTSWDTHRFNSHESRLHIQVQSLDNFFIYQVNCLIPWIYTLSIQCHTWFRMRFNPLKAEPTLISLHTLPDIRGASYEFSAGQGGKGRLRFRWSRRPLKLPNLSHWGKSSFFISKVFPHVSLNKWREGSPIMWVRGGVMDMSEHMGQQCASTSLA